MHIDGVFKHKESRLPLGHGTSNEAEFEILIAALTRIASYVERKGVDKKAVEIFMLTDSTIVANRISGRKKMTATKTVPAGFEALAGEEQKISAKREAKHRMDRLTQKCFDVLQHFQGFQIEWQPRDHNVAKFGH